MFFSIIGFIGIFSFMPLLVVGIVLLIIAKFEKRNLERKRKLKKWGLISIFMPILVTIIGLFGTVIMNLPRAYENINNIQ